jgi:predicted ATP-grasp superfamily ATP-dependent carboligase
VRFDSFLVPLLSRFLGNNSEGFIAFLSYFVWKNTKLQFLVLLSACADPLVLLVIKCC